MNSNAITKSEKVRLKTWQERKEERKESSSTTVYK